MYRYSVTVAVSAINLYLSHRPKRLVAVPHISADTDTQQASQEIPVHKITGKLSLASVSDAERCNMLIIFLLVQKAWLYGIPAAVKCSEPKPLHKKGDRTQPANYRGIQLISIVRKFNALVAGVRLTAWEEEHLVEYQCGFRPKRSYAGQLFSLRQALGPGAPAATTPPHLLRGTATGVR